MKTRIITGFILGVVLIPIFYFGGIVLDIALILFSLIATWELSRMFAQELRHPKIVLVFQILFSGGIFFTIRSYYLGNIALDWVFLLIILLVIVGAMFMIFYEEFTSNEFGNMFISVLYPAIGFGALSALRGAGDAGLYTIGFLFMVTIMTDMFAYIVGINFGKHRLAPKISPKKSIEGSIGGIFFAVIFAMVYLIGFDIEFIGNIEVNYFLIIFVIIIISVLAQIGDLIASKFKRDYGIKDYSNLFPGHGGVMDRFDSAIFAAMILLFISEVVGNL